MLHKMSCEKLEIYFVSYFFLEPTLRIKYQYNLIYFILYSLLELRTGKNTPSMAQKVSCLSFHSAIEA